MSCCGKRIYSWGNVNSEKELLKIISFSEQWFGSKKKLRLKTFLTETTFHSFLDGDAWLACVQNFAARRNKKFNWISSFRCFKQKIGTKNFFHSNNISIILGWGCLKKRNIWHDFIELSQLNTNWNEFFLSVIRFRSISQLFSPRHCKTSFIFIKKYVKTCLLNDP